MSLGLANREPLRLSQQNNCDDEEAETKDWLGNGSDELGFNGENELAEELVHLLLAEASLALEEKQGRQDVGLLEVAEKGIAGYLETNLEPDLSLKGHTSDLIDAKNCVIIRFVRQDTVALQVVDFRLHVEGFRRHFKEVALRGDDRCPDEVRHIGGTCYLGSVNLVRRVCCLVLKHLGVDLVHHQLEPFVAAGVSPYLYQWGCATQVRHIDVEALIVQNVTVLKDAICAVNL